jgi:hypothetical protein
LANLPLASRHLVGLAGAFEGHLMNLPFASRQGVAAIDDVEPATKATAANPKISLRILRLPYLAPFNWAHFDPGSKNTRGVTRCGREA